jgi:hypothetical protein
LFIEFWAFHNEGSSKTQQKQIRGNFPQSPKKTHLLTYVTSFSFFSRRPLAAVLNHIGIWSRLGPPRLGYIRRALACLAHSAAGSHMQFVWPTKAPRDMSLRPSGRFLGQDAKAGHKLPKLRTQVGVWSARRCKPAPRDTGHVVQRAGQLARRDSPQCPQSLWFYILSGGSNGVEVLWGGFSRRTKAELSKLSAG